MRYRIFILFAAFVAAMAGAHPVSAAKVPFAITMVSDRGEPLQTLVQAQEMLTHNSAPAILLDAHSKELRFGGGGDSDSGPFGFNKPFPHVRHFDEANFTLETTDWIAIPTAGAWTFGITSDDGFTMTIDGQTFGHTTRRAARTTLQTIDFPTAGDYQIELTYFQHLGPDELEAFAAPGTHTHMGPRQGFHLINANAFEALQLVDPPQAGDPSDPSDPTDPSPTVGMSAPEPATISLFGVPATLILLRRRR